MGSVFGSIFFRVLCFLVSNGTRNNQEDRRLKASSDYFATDVFAAVFLSNAAALTPNVYGNPWVWTYDEGGNIISKTSSPTPPAVWQALWACITPCATVAMFMTEKQGCITSRAVITTPPGADSLMQTD